MRLSGVQLLKRQATEKPLGVEHYAVGLADDVASAVGYGAEVVIELTPEGLRGQRFDPAIGWERVAEALDVVGAVRRLKHEIARHERYSLSSRNCEHFARSVVLGNEESTQVRNVLSVVALV